MNAVYGGKLNFKGVKAVMREPGVRAELLRRMERAAAKAGPGHTAYMDERPAEHLPAARVNGDLRREAQTGYLSASLDASGGSA